MWNIQVLPCQMPGWSMAANWWVCNVGLNGWLSLWCCQCHKKQVKIRSASLSETDCAQTGVMQRRCCAASSKSTRMLLFWLLELFAGLQFQLQKGTSGLFLKICEHTSKCVRLTHQGVCPIWSVLANFILLCLHGKRSEASIETRVMACFALWPNCLSTCLPWRSLNKPFWLVAYESDMAIKMKLSCQAVWNTHVILARSSQYHISPFDSVGYAKALRSGKPDRTYSWHAAAYMNPHLSLKHWRIGAFAVWTCWLGFPAWMNYVWALTAFTQ